MIKIKKGDLIHEVLEGKYDIIAHGCNCFCTMGAGFAVPMKMLFGCDQFPMEQSGFGDPNKLGQIDFKLFNITDNHLGKRSAVPHRLSAGDPTLVVINAYTQFRYGRNHPEGDQQPLDYDALKVCFKKINMMFDGQGKKLGLPAIGCGLAGGDLFSVLLIASKELTGVDTTFVIRDQYLWETHKGTFEALQRDGKLTIE